MVPNLQNDGRTHFGMSACCSLDELGKRPSSSTDPVFPRPYRPGLVRAYASHQAHNNAGVHQPGRAPRILQPHAAPAAAGACRRTAHPRGPEGCRRPGRRARLPHQGACTGGSRLWFPVLRLAFQKLSSSCGNSGGRNWVRTSDPSLVRRKRPTKRSSSQSRLHALDLRKPCTEMPRMSGKVCTVVPASGSRSNVRDHHSPAWSKGSRLLCLSPALPRCQA
jgi:hypothetical protein